MSVVTLQVGQCGNQVGGQLFEGIAQDAKTKLSQTNLTQQGNADYVEEVMDRFFHISDNPGRLPEARAVMVDMEPKVRDIIHLSTFL